MDTDERTVVYGLKRTKRKHWVRCCQCGVLDESRTPKFGLDYRVTTISARNVGTSTEMRCIDCAGSDGKATMCRSCCPTRHGTKMENE